MRMPVPLPTPELTLINNRIFLISGIGRGTGTGTKNQFFKHDVYTKDFTVHPDHPAAYDPAYPIFLCVRRVVDLQIQTFIWNHTKFQDLSKTPINPLIHSTIAFFLLLYYLLIK
jgi:hypothetical protein